MTTRITGLKNPEDLFYRPLDKVASMYATGKMGVDPPQRPSKIWKSRPQQALIKTMIKGIRLPCVDSQRYADGFVALQDGQQRVVNAIRFLKGKLRIEKPKPSTQKYKSDKEFYLKYGGKKISSLPKDIQKKIKNYPIKFSEEISDDPKDGEDYYERVNTLGSNLNRPEISKIHNRHSALWKIGHTLSKKYGKFYFNFGILSDTQINRSQDQLLTEELLILIQNGAQSSSKLKHYYQMWNNEVPNKNDLLHDLDEIFKYIQKVYPKGLGRTRFYNNTNNFYALVGALASKFAHSQNLKNPKTVNNNLKTFMGSVFNGRTAKGSKAYWDTLQEGTKSKEHRKQRIAILCKII